MSGVLAFFSDFVVAILAVGATLLAIFAASSLREKETRAAARGSIATLILLAVMAVAILLFRWIPDARLGAGVLGIALVLGALYLLAPARQTAKGTRPPIRGEVRRFDERDNIWARARTLHPNREDLPEYQSYYRAHPGRRAFDDRTFTHAVGERGCMDKANFHNKLVGGVGLNPFLTRLGAPEMATPAVKPPDEKYFHAPDPERLTLLVKGLCRRLGADVVGVADLDPSWVYSHRGQIHRGDWEDWGKEISLPHPRVVVFGMGMDPELVRTAPYSPCDVEVYQQYVKAAVVSVELAHVLAAMGYSAKAHHLRGQDLLMVPAAVDAGLGELGRCGGVVTRRFGTRIRLGAVTTDAPLVADEPVALGVAEFCDRCQRCARQCPSGAISRLERQTVNGSLRWAVDAEKCYEYWMKSGTHCSLCLASCPWSHGDTFVHRALKAAAIHFRRLHPLMVWADDVFYGSKINPRLGPEWIDFRRPRRPPATADRP